jgi:(4-(4-[2-(gamma-L-glutamylamino)ethyl]phenoxymethyl)furan-2-yl)methanamine synthase
MDWLAFDIGGANLKAADGCGFALQHAFPLWRDPQRLAAELRTMIAESPPADRLAVTMTGELADCFESKLEGVKAILQSVHEAADGRHTRIYLTDGRLVAPTVVHRDPLAAAASNWHALATFVTRFAPEGNALLIDIGSTTTDIVPIHDGRILAVGRDDLQRLISGELVYAGVSRTPLCGLISTSPYREQLCPVMQEVFATTKDAYLILGELGENTTDQETADHRPATRRAARLRMCRMVGADESQFNMRDAVRMAQHVQEAQLQRYAEAVRQVVARQDSVPDIVILSGEGEFLGRKLLSLLGWEPDVVSMGQRLGPHASRAAPAHALAVLARESTQSFP